MRPSPLFCLISNLCVALVLTLVLGGCVNYPLNVPEPNFKSALHKKTSTAYLWGLLKEPELVAEECGSGPGALGFVRIKDNLGYDLLSVLTLGMVKPMEVEYRCAASRPEPGDGDDLEG